MRRKEQKNFIALCEKHGGPLKKIGSKKYEFTCLCPFHNEKTPSFRLNKSTLEFYCFGCAAGGKGFQDLERQLRKHLADQSTRKQIMTDLSKSTTAPELGCNTLPSLWHVWEVESYFYAAQSLEEAKQACSNDWGIDEDQLEQWDDRHCDAGGFYRNATCYDYDEDNPDCTMRERAEEMLQEGETLPFMVAVSFE